MSESERQMRQIASLLIGGEEKQQVATDILDELGLDLLAKDIRSYHDMQLEEICSLAGLS